MKEMERKNREWKRSDVRGELLEDGLPWAISLGQLFFPPNSEVESWASPFVFMLSLESFTS